MMFKTIDLLDYFSIYFVALLYTFDDLMYTRKLGAKVQVCAFIPDQYNYLN